MKKLLALLLSALLCTSALAEITVEVNWMIDAEYYTTIKTDTLSLCFDWQKWCYRTQEGLLWQADPIVFPELEPLLMPQSTEEVLAMNTLYAALDDASGFWNETAWGKGKLAVYSAPDTASLRGAKGKAAVELSGFVKLMMTRDDWSLVEYEIDHDESRIGWVRTNQLGSAPVTMTDVGVRLKEDAFLTDDPHCSWRHVLEAKELSDVHLLVGLDAFWGYVSAKTASGQTVWGFVPMRSMVHEDMPVPEMMDKLAGDWGFAGGGELMGELFTMAADGTITYWHLPEEEMFRQTYLTEGLAQQQQLTMMSQHSWQIVQGTGGYEYDLLLSSATGRQGRLHITYNEDEGILDVMQGDAGGSWQRLSK